MSKILLGAAAALLLSGCTSETEASPSAAGELFTRYCTLCARVETATSFCRTDGAGKSSCLVSSSRPNPDYCRLALGNAGGAVSAVRCRLSEAEWGVQCEIRNSGARPAAEFSSDYCLK